MYWGRFKNKLLKASNWISCRWLEDILWELTAFLPKRTGLFSLIIFHTHPIPGVTSKPPDIFNCHSLCSYFSCSSLIWSLSGLRSTRFHQTHVRLWHPFCPLLQSVFSGTLENKSQWEKGDAFSTITGPSNWRGPLTFACLLLCRKLCLANSSRKRCQQRSFG